MLTALDDTDVNFSEALAAGYGGDASCTAGPASGWSIEVDTYFNSGQDPTRRSCHVYI